MRNFRFIFFILLAVILLVLGTVVGIKLSEASLKKNPVDIISQQDNTTRQDQSALLDDTTEFSGTVLNENDITYSNGVVTLETSVVDSTAQSSSVAETSAVIVSSAVTTTAAQANTVTTTAKRTTTRRTTTKRTTTTTEKTTVASTRFFSYQMIPGQSFDLVMTGAAKKTVFSFSSTNPDIVSVDSSGRVTAHTVGNATVYATARNSQDTWTYQISVLSE